MAEQQENFKKLTNAKSNLKSELRNIHKDLVSKLKDVFGKMVEKNKDQYDLVRRTENPNSFYPVLEQWLDDITKNNDKFCLHLEAISTQLLTETLYSRALIFKDNFINV